MTSTKKVNKFRANAKSKGYVRRDYYATEQEHQKIRRLLFDLRDK